MSGGGCKTRPVELTRLRKHYRSPIGYRTGPRNCETATADEILATIPGRWHVVRRLPTLWLVFTREPTLMHYPRKISNIKRVRKLGFRARMKTRLGRQMISRKRRLGRRLAAA